MEEALSAAVGPAPRCAVHPTERARETCRRCGRFCCEACVAGQAPALCSSCASLVTDPFGLQGRDFDFGAAVVLALRLLAAEAWRVVALVLCVTGVSYGVNVMLLPGSSDASTSGGYGLGSLLEFLVGLIFRQALLAVLFARTEGRRLPLLHALNEGLWAWPRTASAVLRQAVSVTLWTLLLILPGIRRSVVLQFTDLSALRCREGDPLERSERITLPSMGPAFALFGGVVVVQLAGWGLPVLVDRWVQRLGVDAPIAVWLVEAFLGQLTNLALAMPFLVVGFHMLHTRAGVALPAMAWRRPPPFLALADGPRAVSP